MRQFGTNEVGFRIDNTRDFVMMNQRNFNINVRELSMRPLVVILIDIMWPKSQITLLCIHLYSLK